MQMPPAEGQDGIVGLRNLGVAGPFPANLTSMAVLLTGDALQVESSIARSFSAKPLFKSSFSKTFL